MKKFRIKCTTEDVFHPVIASDSGPTKCPVDDTHTVDTSLNSILEDDVDYSDTTPKEVTLDEYKQFKIHNIDKVTVGLILQGFIFDSTLFSLSENAQTNWLGLKALQGVLTWPVEITTKNDGAYSLSQTNLDFFLGQAMGTKQAHLDSGRAIKSQVIACTTEAEVDAIEDNR